MFLLMLEKVNFLQIFLLCRSCVFLALKSWFQLLKKNPDCYQTLNLLPTLTLRKRRGKLVGYILMNLCLMKLHAYTYSSIHFVRCSFILKTNQKFWSCESSYIIPPLRDGIDPRYLSRVLINNHHGNIPYRFITK